jgi:deferrochelatase/peroxidase EfeB
LGEFLLGYPNEYGRYTDRPLLEPTRDGSAMLPRAEDAPDKADLGRNGSYLVMRQLHQDVAGFWQWLDRQAAGDPNQRTRLAEAMVGRTLTGEPLVGLTREAIAGGAASPQPDLNAFTYGSDPRGVRCPLGAHVRRTNPRNADLPPGRPGILSRLERVLGFNAQARELDLAASTRFHRLLRRGREYGPEMPLSQALSGVPAAGETGLHFVCLNGNIGRQFEFVQSAWIAGSRFSGLSGERDPLVGHRRPELDGTNTDRFSMPQADGPDRQLTGLPQFITVLGGAYFFLPGIRALRYLATAR